jgi:SH3-like domain-containing protein
MKRALITLIMMVACAIAAAPSDGAERFAVAADTANVRSGPGLKNDQLWQIEKYHPLLVLEKKEEWVRIKDFEGDEGWVHRSLVEKIDTVIVKVNQCNIRKGPGTQFDILFSVDKGIPFKVLQRKDKWIEVQHADGDRGWILNTLVW